MNAQPTYLIFLALSVLAVLMITLGITQSNQIGKGLKFTRDKMQENRLTALRIGSPLTPHKPRIQKFPFKVEGHRGAGALEPENTIKSYKRAIDLELDGIELDVWLTKDHVPIISHNNISTYGDKDYLVLKHWVQEAGRYLLTLEEVLDICKDKINLNIELKDPQEAVVGRVLDLLVEKGMLGQVMLSSFHHYLRETLTMEVAQRNILTKVNFGFLMNIYNVRFPDYASAAQPGDAIIVDFRYLVEKRKQCLAEIDKAHRHGVQVSFWFYTGFKKESALYDELVNVGVDKIVSNYPLEVIKHFEGRKGCKECEGEVKV